MEEPKKPETKDESIFGNIPHLIIGKKKEEFKEPPESLFNQKETKLIDNFKKWGLVIAVTIIVLYAAYRILKGWLF